MRSTLRGAGFPNRARMTGNTETETGLSLLSGVQREVTSGHERPVTLPTSAFPNHNFRVADKQESGQNPFNLARLTIISKTSRLKFGIRSICTITEVWYRQVGVRQVAIGASSQNYAHLR